MACQNFAVTDESSLAYGVQSACGTPQTVLTALRYTSDDIALTTEASESNEIRSDRNVTDLIRTSASLGGSVGFELSYETFDPFFQALLQSTTALDGAGTPIKNGKAKKYFTMERNVPTSSGNNYTSWSDLQVASLDLSIQQGDVGVTGSWTMLGQGLPVNSGTSIDGSGYTAANTNPIYSIVSGVGEVEVDGVVVGSVQSVNLTISNNLREQRALGAVSASGIANGRFTVTGSTSIYFENNTMSSKFINDGTFTLKITLEDSMGTTSGNIYEIWLPKLKFSNLTNSIPGVGQDVILAGDFQALYNSTEDGTITIASTDAV